MKHDNGEFSIDKHELRAMMAFSMAKGQRPQLEAVHFCPVRGAVYATDGHTLVRVANGSTADVPAFTAPLALLTNAYKMLTRDSVVIVRSSGDQIRCQVGAHSISAPDTELTGPAGPWNTVEDVIPKKDNFFKHSNVPSEVNDMNRDELLKLVKWRLNFEPIVGLNVKYLRRLELVQKACGKNGIELYRGGGKLDPQLFTCDNPRESTSWTAVLMPMRTG